VRSGGKGSAALWPLGSSSRHLRLAGAGVDADRGGHREPARACLACLCDERRDAPPSLTVGDEAGRLDLLLPEKPKDAGKEEMSLWVFQNGLPIPIDVLSRWIAGFKGSAGL
jgi:hypothetical protein